jgi:long-chain fatty acid transport protein
LVTDYDPDWVGRYHSVRSELLTVNINPSVAYKPTEWLSIGAGLNIQYIYTDLNNALDTGAAVTPGSADSFLRVSGDGFGFGFNAGVLLEPIEGTRLGVHYRSEVGHNINGGTVLDAHPALPVIGGGTFNGNATAQITLPDTVAISVFHQLTPEIVLLGDATWTEWSDIPALVINISGLPIANGAAVTPLNWMDTWRFSGGAIWEATNELALRVGYAFDESPVPSATFRTPRVPDNDRHWATIGGTYTIKDGIDLSMAYAHLFVADTPIANNDPSPVNHFLIGEYDSAVDIISFQMTVSMKAINDLF